MTSLRARFESWLAEHYRPHGTVRRMPAYEVSPLLLGGAHQDVVDAWRAGGHMAARVRAFIEDIVEIWDPQTILEHRCRYAVERELATGRRHQQIFGHAPDGGELEAWEERVIARHERVYGVDLERRASETACQVSLEDMSGRAA